MSRPRTRAARGGAPAPDLVPETRGPRYYSLARRGLHTPADMSAFSLAITEAHALQQISTARYNQFVRGIRAYNRSRDIVLREWQYFGGPQLYREA